MKNILRQQRRSSMVAAVVTILMGVLLIFCVPCWEAL